MDLSNVAQQHVPSALASVKKRDHLQESYPVLPDSGCLIKRAYPVSQADSGCTPGGVSCFAHLIQLAYPVLPDSGYIPMVFVSCSPLIQRAYYLNQALQESIRLRSYSTFEKLLESVTDINVINQKDLLRLAAENGFLPPFCKLDLCDTWLSFLAETAARHGQIDVVKWLRTYDYKGKINQIGLFDAACYSNDLSVVKEVYSGRKCIRKYCFEAKCIQGDLEIAQWMYQQCPDILSSEDVCSIIDTSLSNLNRLKEDQHTYQLVEWFYSLGLMHDTAERFIFVKALEYGKPQIAEMIIKRNVYLQEDCSCEDSILIKAIRRGNCHSIIWLIQKLSMQVTDIHEHLTLDDLIKMAHSAMHSGNVETIEWVFSNFPITPQEIDICIKTLAWIDGFYTVLWLMQKNLYTFTEDEIDMVYQCLCCDVNRDDVVLVQNIVECTHVIPRKAFYELCSLDRSAVIEVALTKINFILDMEVFHVLLCKGLFRLLEQLSLSMQGVITEPRKMEITVKPFDLTPENFKGLSWVLETFPVLELKEIPGVKQTFLLRKISFGQYLCGLHIPLSVSQESCVVCYRDGKQGLPLVLLSCQHVICIDCAYLYDKCQYCMKAIEQYSEQTIIC